MRRAWVCSVAIVLGSTAAVRPDDDAVKHALALEATIQKAVETAEPSIACILVSRSEGYSKLGARFNPGASGEPGRLGSFNPNADARFDARGGNQDKDLIARLNLAAPDTVPDSYGSGVVIDASGLILTNRHVIQDATKIYVRLPGKRNGSYANIHAADERSDLAVLKLIDPPDGLKALPMGDADHLKKGQFVLSVANPFAAGFKDGSPSVSWGMLSNIRRRLPGEQSEERRKPKLRYYGTLLQTDIRMPLGCSGGALLDLRGNWIGLTTSISGVAGGESAGGYAIPIDTRMKRIIGKLRAGLEVEYGFLGIVQNRRFRDEWVPTRGGPAAKAGMVEGETIVSIDGHPIEEQDDMLIDIAAALAGTEVRMVVEGFGQRREIRPRLAKTNWQNDFPVIAANRPKPVYGLRVDYTSVQLISGVPGSVEIPPGVLVRDVIPDSPAAKAGLAPERQIILAVNGEYVNTPDEFYEAARKANGKIELTLREGDRKVTLP